MFRLFKVVINNLYLLAIFFSCKMMASQNYQVGQGVSDITGPAAEVVMMGYANPKQVTAGIHTRLYARAFIFADSNLDKSIVFVSTDLAHMYSSIKQGVIKKLQALYGNLYTDENILLAATHTHSGPGGFSHHTLYNITSHGLIKQNYEVIVNGIVEAITQAHSSLKPSRIGFSSGDLTNKANINRSPEAFRLNQEMNSTSPPSFENPQMSLLKIEDSKGPRGVISWFAVHATSLSRDNQLISSDNKGLASYEFEKLFGSIPPFVNPGQFVAAFPNSAEGDMSPNTLPGFQRPGGNDFEALRISGTSQFNAAYKLFNSPQKFLSGPIDSRLLYVKMPGYKVNQFTLCHAAMGFSFAAGAEDGPSGIPGFHEGMTQKNLSAQDSESLAIDFFESFLPFNFISDVLTKEQSLTNSECQFPKPTLLPTGFLGWTPEILPFQILRLGNLAIIAIPGEMTIQAGRRLEKQILFELRPLKINHAIITGLANEYSSYITTPEEYLSQQYEGASTLYGQHTFEAYQQIFSQVTTSLITETPIINKITPPDLSQDQFSFQPGVLFDIKKSNEEFGTVLQQPDSIIKIGSRTSASFRSGHPKNDLKTNSTYFTIEHLNPQGEWKVIAWDAMPETQFSWKRDYTSDCFGCSKIEVQWQIPLNAQLGAYRIRHSGAWKSFFNGKITPYEGITQTFNLTR